MKTRIHYQAATYGPMQYKTFAGALGVFFEHECPQLGGQRTRRVLVQAVIDMVNRFYPETHHLRQGQIQWTTIDREEKASYGKRISHSRLRSVVLDLVRPEDAIERAEGKKLREMKKEAVGRLMEQAYAQGGCLTNAEAAILLKISAPTVGKYCREIESEQDRLLPRRGTIHDLGPTLSHKKTIVRKLFLEGKSVGAVSRETYHSPDAIHRYIVAFRQVLLCRRKGLSEAETAFAVKFSARLVRQYMELIDEMAKQNIALERLLELEKGVSM